MCTWTVAGGVEYITLMPEGLDAHPGRQAGTGEDNYRQVSGVGDDTYYLTMGKNVGIIGKKGDIAFKVAVYGGAPLDKKEAMEKTLASQAVSRL